MSQTTTQTPVPFPKSVITLMASREERYHHFLWHNIRDGWNRFSAETQKQLTDLKWNPPRPSRNYDANGNPIAITDNNSGEDFLYMHRQMVKKVNDLLVQTKDPYGKLKSWTKIPAPGDKDFPVPPDYMIKGNTATSNTIKSYKSLDYYNTKIKPMEDMLTNPVELRKMTLGQMGSRIETTIHNWLHLRFSNESTYGYRPGTTNALPNFDKKWDDPRYDWLGDTYSSHVNPVFWGLHGWVNDRVEAWARANNLTVITWRGIWQGGPMKNLNSIIGTNAKRVAMPTISRSDSNTNLRGGATSADDDNVMEKVLNILRNEKESSFADEVKIDIPLPKPKTTASRSKTR